VKPSSNGEKPSPIRRAMSTLVLRDPSPPRPRTSTREPAPPEMCRFWGRWAGRCPAGGSHAQADSTVKMTTNKAALLGPQQHGHPLSCRHLHAHEDAPQRGRGHHLGGSSSVCAVLKQMAGLLFPLVFKSRIVLLLLGASIDRAEIVFVRVCSWVACSAACAF